MLTDEDAVRAANRRFYHAMQNADLAGMRAVWSTEGMVTCVHAACVMIAGWDDVMESWSILLDDIAKWRIAIEERWIDVRGDLGWVVAVERFEMPESAEEDASESAADAEEEGEGEEEEAGAGEDTEGEVSLGGMDGAESSLVTEEGAEEDSHATEAGEEAEGQEEGEEAEGDEEGEEEDDEEEDDDEEDDEDDNRRVVISTHVYRREDGEWKLVHRHSSPASTKYDTPGYRRVPGPAN